MAVKPWHAHLLPNLPYPRSPSAPPHTPILRNSARSFAAGSRRLKAEPPPPAALAWSPSSTPAVGTSTSRHHRQPTRAFSASLSGPGAGPAPLPPPAPPLQPPPPLTQGQNVRCSESGLSGATPPLSGVRDFAAATPPPGPRALDACSALGAASADCAAWALDGAPSAVSSGALRRARLLLGSLPSLFHTRQGPSV